VPVKVLDPEVVAFVTVVVTLVDTVVLTEDTFPPFTASIPPTGAASGGDVEIVAFLAFSAKAASVLPVAGALIAANMPD